MPEGWDYEACLLIPKPCSWLSGNRTVLHILSGSFLFSAIVLLESGTNPRFSTRALHTAVFLLFNAGGNVRSFFSPEPLLESTAISFYCGGLVLTLGTLGVLLIAFLLLFQSSGSLAGLIFSLAFSSDSPRRFDMQEPESGSGCNCRSTAKQLQTDSAPEAQNQSPLFVHTLNISMRALRQEDPPHRAGNRQALHLMRYVIYESDVDALS